MNDLITDVGNMNISADTKMRLHDNYKTIVIERAASVVQLEPLSMVPNDQIWGQGQMGQFFISFGKYNELVNYMLKLKEKQELDIKIEGLLGE